MHWLWEERRFGKFKISIDIIKNDPYSVMQALNGVVILDSYYEYMSESLVYTGLCAQFDPVSEGALPTWYVLGTREDGTLPVFLNSGFYATDGGFVWQKN